MNKGTVFHGCNQFLQSLIPIFESLHFASYDKVHIIEKSAQQRCDLVTLPLSVAPKILSETALHHLHLSSVECRFTEYLVRGFVFKDKLLEVAMQWNFMQDFIEQTKAILILFCCCWLYLT